ncbi:type IIL restriction-modification enzyme MmeI [Croceicoccus sp. Ery5]|uniref:type IIL restriction-modification enzyme MmeI n=1 Tax=Croceicoccus sp. Ery5 TaxID=1703340 RepID=UPI00351CD064
MNAVEIEEAISELAAQPFDRAEFPFAFLEAFGRKANTLKQLRAGTTNASDLPAVSSSATISISPLANPGDGRRDSEVSPR